MKIYYTDHFDLPLPDGHRFPMGNIGFKHVVQSEHHLKDTWLCHPQRLTINCRPVIPIGMWMLFALEISVPRKYVASDFHGQKWRNAHAAALGQHLLQVGQRDRWRFGEFAGGTHHAMRDAGEGYCVFNDAG